MSPRRVVVTGLGALTPIGNSVPAYWEGLISGTSGAAPITYFDPVDFKTQFACELKDFDPQILQKLLSTISGGMAVALYTTLTGLISSMLLKFQYFLIDSSLSQTLNYLNSKYE